MPAVPNGVVTVPLESSILRITWLNESATYALPAPSSAIPSGTLKRAAAPIASVLPLEPEPAEVIPASVSSLAPATVRNVSPTLSLK